MTKTPRDQLAQVIAERTLRESDTKKLAVAIAAYLLSEHRLHELEPLLRDVMQYRLDHGLIEADVTTSHDLTAEAERDLAALLKDEYPHSRGVHLNLKHDEQLVGGLRVDLPNEQLDATVRGRISAFKRLIGAGV